MSAENGNGTQTLTVRAAIELRQRVLKGDFSGGTRLYEVELANELHISRTPVRAALSRLAEEGLLERAPGGGFLVRRFAFDDVVDTIELRGVLEGTAARLAAERGVSDDRRAEMQSILRQLDACFPAGEGDMDFEAFAILNSQFHTALSRLAGSSTIEAELERVKQLPFASPSAFLPQEHRQADFHHAMRTAQGQHRAIIEAIDARQGSRAEALAREHANTARANLQRIFNADGSFSGEFPAFALMAQLSG